MCEPCYQEFTPQQIPVVEREDGARIRVIAGESAGTLGAVTGIATDPLYLDVSLPARSRFEQGVPSEHNVLAYVFEDEGEFGSTPKEQGKTLGPGNLAAFSKGGRVCVVTRDSAVRFLLLAARPFGEPVARYGPFVMNTEEQIRQALRDYREGTFLD